MEQEILKLFTAGKLPELEKVLKSAKASELTSLIDGRVLRGKGDPAALLRAIFGGSPASTEDGVKRRLHVVKHAIDLFQCHDLGSKVTAELTGVILSEVDLFPPSCLVELANYYVEGIKNGIITNSRCLELFPKILSSLEVKDAVSINGSEMKGLEYKNHVLNSLCSCRWGSDVILHLVAMLKDVTLSLDELRHVIAKTLRHFRDVDPQELPPLVYQLLLLSTKGHKKLVLDGVIAYFVDQDAKHSGKSAAEHSEEDDSPDAMGSISADELHHIEGTVILHITFAIKQDQQLGREFIKYFKIYQQFSMSKVLSPFTVALALSLGRIHSFEEQVFDLLKSAIIKSYRDTERQRSSCWVRDFTSDRPDCAQQVLETIKNSVVGWDHITQGLVQLGFVLMEAFGPRLSFGRHTSASHCNLTPAQAACQLGVQMLRNTFRVHDAARKEIIEQLLNSIVTKATAPVMHYLELLTSLIKTSPHFVLDCVPRLREAFDYLAFLPLSCAEGLLVAICPLLRLSSSLRDSLVVVLRKAVFSRHVESRRIAVSGFLMLLNNHQILGGSIPSSQSASQNTNFGSSQVLVDVHSSQSAAPSEALCLEILNTLRRCLTQQADVRLVLYEGLYNALKSNESLLGSVIGVLSDQFRHYMESQPDACPPVRLDACIALQGDKPYVTEPLAHLLSSLVHCILYKKQSASSSNMVADEMDDDDTNRVVAAAVELIKSFVMRMIKCEPEDFELDKSADFSAVTGVGMRNTIMALLVCGLYEVLMEFEFLSSDYEVEQCQQVVKLFQNFQRISEVLKEKPATTAGGPKKRGRQPKDSSAADISTESHSSGGLLSIGFLSSALVAIYSDNVPSHHEGIAILSSNLDLQRYLVTTTVTRLQQINQHGYCDGVKGHEPEHLTKCCIQIGQILLKQYCGSFSSTTVPSTNAGTNAAKPSNDSVKNRTFISTCLEGFAHIMTLFCTRYVQHLSSFLKTLDKRHASDKSAADVSEDELLISRNIQKLQRITLAVLTSGEERPVHDAAVLIGIIGQLSQLLKPGNASLADIENWLLRLGKEQTVDDQGVVKTLLQQLLAVSRKQSSALESCRDLAHDIHISLGDIDQDVEVDAASKKYGIIGTRGAAAVVHIILGHVDVEIDDVEWIVSRMKAESAELADKLPESTQKETAEKSVCTRLGHLINCCHELLQSALPVGPCIDSLMRVIVRLYVVLTLLVKWSLSQYTRKCGQMSSRFEKLVKLSGTNLTQCVYPMITYIQASQSERLQTDVDKVKKKKKGKNKCLVPSADKTRILKEIRSIPNLIYSIEQYEKFLIQLSKKSKIDLMVNFKMSTSRDFRINAASLQAAIEREAEESGNEDMSYDDAADCENHNTSNTADEDAPPATKKSKPAATSQQKTGPKKTKGKLGKK